jgi:cell wall integrity and stress response component
MQFSIISAGLLLLAPLASAVSGTGPTQAPKESPRVGYPTSQGCFKSSKGLTDVGMEETQVSSGGCREACQAIKKPVFAMGGGVKCFCGDSYPPKSDLTDDSACDYPCQAYPLEACGNIDETAFSVWNTGDKLSVPFYDGKDEDSSSTASGASKTATSTSASGSKTAVSTSIITGAVESETGLATAASASGETASSTESAAVATSSIPSSGAKSMMGAGVAIFVAALAV